MYINDFAYIKPVLTQQQSLKIDFNDLLLQQGFKPTAQWRRYSTSSKIATLLAQQLWPFDGVEQPSSIHIGSALAMIEDTDKFLNQMGAFPPHQLSPTPFIQSTHNTVSGQLALQYQSHGHNSTFSQGLQSFDDAFLDAQLQIGDSNQETSCLVGAVEEVNELGEEIIQTQYPQLRKEKIMGGGAFFHMSYVNHNSPFRVLKHIYLYGTELPKPIQQYLDLKSFEGVLTNSSTIIPYILSEEVECKEIALPFSYSNVAVLMAQMLDFFKECQKKDLVILYSFDRYWSFWHIEKCN